MATTYLSPGVYVEEIPSGINPIAGVGTSTAAFLGIVKDDILLNQVAGETLPAGDGSNKVFAVKNYPVIDDPKKIKVYLVVNSKLSNDFTNNKATGKFDIPLPKNLTYTCDYSSFVKVTADPVGTGDGTNRNFLLTKFPVLNDPKSVVVRAGTAVVSGSLDVSTPNKPFVLLDSPPSNGVAVTADYVVTSPTVVKGEVITLDDAGQSFTLTKFPVATDAATIQVVGVDSAATVKNDASKLVSQITLSFAPPATQPVQINYTVRAPLEMVRLCTNFSEFKRSFGDFSTIPNQNMLAQAVYGFFNNGGTRCYVALTKDESRISAVLDKLAAIDDISLVAAPGQTSKTVASALIAHCEVATGDRFAILDCPQTVETGDLMDLTLLTTTSANSVLPPVSNYAACYFPWIQVFDPASKGPIWVPPSGHMAGVYARVDSNRGVHKAPANEIVFGALDVKYRLSKPMQDGLNPQGVNCIRSLNGNITIWGARTVGGDGNGEWKYINVRRLFLFLRKSIDLGTQWVVFEPNDPSLWAKITRNVTAFLLNVWHSGALFGTTPQEAFYVKCDAETNTPESRDAGQVVTEIGVAVVYPAEFVIFRISQWAGSGGK